MKVITYIRAFQEYWEGKLYVWFLCLAGRLVGELNV